MKVTLSLRLTPSEVRALKALAQRRQTSVSQLLTQGMQRVVDNPVKPTWRENPVKTTTVAVDHDLVCQFKALMLGSNRSVEGGLREVVADLLADATEDPDAVPLAA